MGIILFLKMFLIGRGDLVILYIGKMEKLKLLIINPILILVIVSNF